MIQLNIPELAVLAVGTLITTIVGFFVKRWLKKETDRRDKEKKAIQMYMVRTDSIVAALVQVLNGKGDEFKHLMQADFKARCEEKGLST